MWTRIGIFASVLFLSALSTTDNAQKYEVVFVISGSDEFAGNPLHIFSNKITRLVQHLISLLIVNNRKTSNAYCLSCISVKSTNNSVEIWNKSCSAGRKRFFLGDKVMRRQFYQRTSGQKELIEFEQQEGRICFSSVFGHTDMRRVGTFTQITPLSPNYFLTTDGLLEYLRKAPSAEVGNAVGLKGSLTFCANNVFTDINSREITKVVLFLVHTSILLSEVVTLLGEDIYTTITTMIIFVVFPYPMETCQSAQLVISHLQQRTSILGAYCGLEPKNISIHKDFDDMLLQFYEKQNRFFTREKENKVNLTLSTLDESYKYWNSLQNPSWFNFDLKWRFCAEIYCHWLFVGGVALAFAVFCSAALMMKTVIQHKRHARTGAGSFDYAHLLRRPSRAPPQSAVSAALMSAFAANMGALPTTVAGGATETSMLAAAMELNPMVHAIQRETRRTTTAASRRASLAKAASASSMRSSRSSAAKSPANFKRRKSAAALYAGLQVNLTPPTTDQRKKLSLQAAAGRRPMSIMA